MLFGRAEQGQKAARQLPARERSFERGNLCAEGLIGRLGLTKSLAEQSNDLPSSRLVAEHKTSACRARGLVAEHKDLELRKKTYWLEDWTTKGVFREFDDVG